MGATTVTATLWTCDGPECSQQAYGDGNVPEGWLLREQDGKAFHAPRCLRESARAAAIMKRQGDVWSSSVAGELMDDADPLATSERDALKAEIRRLKKRVAQLEQEALLAAAPAPVPEPPEPAPEPAPAPIEEPGADIPADIPAEATAEP